jgi:ABC-2 type transport system permease protein
MFSVQLRKEWHELIATRRVLVVLVVMIVLGLLSPITAKVLPDLLKSMETDESIQVIVGEPTLRDAISQYTGNIGELAMFMVLLMSFITVVSERERGFMTLIFPHGLGRTTFILAKFTALASLIALGMIVGGIAAYLYTMILFEAPHLIGFMSMLALLYLYLLMFVAIGILGSTVGKSTGSAAGITFGLLMVVLIAGSLFSFAPSKVLEWALALGIHEAGQTHWTALLINGVVIIVSIALSCGVLHRQAILANNG